MKKISEICTIIVLFCILITNKSLAAGLSPLNTNVGEEQKKRIYVVYDNSSSMYLSDNSSQAVTRWVEADYAVRALAAMMNEEDKLKIFVMGDYKTGLPIPEKASANSWESTGSKMDYVDKVLGELKFTEWTYFEAVEAAAEELKEYDDGEDCWIVILTDGAFSHPENVFPKYSDKKERLQSELYKITEDSNISIAYVPIGNEEGLIKLDENLNKRIYVPNESDGEKNEDKIIRDVTDVINKIYQRVYLNKDIEKKYVSTETTGLEFSAGIPMERVIVFMQSAGKETTFEEYKKNRTSEPSGESGKNVRDKDVIMFSGIDTIPEAEENVEGHNEIAPKHYDDVEFKYRELKGAIKTFSSTEQNTNGVYSYDMADFDTVNIYYQPAVDVKIEYQQEGEKVAHLNECETDADIGVWTDRCIQEGQLDIQLTLVNKQTETMIEDDEAVFDLLYPENFEVYLKPWDGEESQRIELRSQEDFVYSCSVEVGKYELTIRTPWNEQKTICLDVQRKRKAVDAVLASKEEIWIEHQEDESSIAAFQLRQDGENLGTEELKDIEQLQCISRDDDFVAEFLDISDDGLVRFRIGLKDPDKDDIASEADFYLTGKRDYGIGKPDELMSGDIRLKIRSDEFELSVETEAECFKRWVMRMFQDEPVEVKYFCNGQELTGIKRKNLNVKIIGIEPEQMTPYLEIGEDLNFYLKKGKFFGEPVTNQVNITMEISYTRKATTETINLVKNMGIQNVPLGVQIIAIILITLIISWILLCLLWVRSDYHIPNYKTYLVSKNGRKSTRVYLKRGMHLFVPGWKKVNLVYKAPRSDNDPFIRDFNMKLQKDLLGGGLELLNCEDFSDENRFRIGGSPIIEENKTIRQELQFSLFDKYKNEMLLVFKDER